MVLIVTSKPKTISAYDACQLCSLSILGLRSVDIFAIIQKVV